LSITKSADFTDATMAIVIGTYYRGTNDPRYELPLKTLEDWRALGPEKFPVVVADASPEHEEITRPFSLRGAHVLDARDTPGIAPQNLLGIRFALERGAPFIMRVEPEKYGWAELALVIQILAALNRGVDILSVGRTPKSMQTLPPVQLITESVMSRLLARLRLLGSDQRLPEDTASGVRAMSRRGAEHMLKFDLANGTQWEFLWYSLITAMAGGLNVDGVLLDYVHPQEMSEQEAGDPAYNAKRLGQVDLIVPKVIAFALENGFVVETGQFAWTI
jgi:hypothetical protein